MIIPEIGADLFQISADKVDEVFCKFRGNLFFSPVDEMEAYVIFKNLRHEAVDAATNRGQKHQLVAAIGIAFKRALHGIQLPAHLADPLQQLHLFTFMERHRVKLLDHTHPGYGINKEAAQFLHPRFYPLCLLCMVSERHFDASFLRFALF